jgi:hypothetical protein
MVGSYTLSSRSLDGLPLACGANVHASICRRDLWYFADPWGSGSTFCAWTGTAAFFFVGSGPEPGFICKRRTAFSDSRPAATNRRGPNCASRPGRTVPVLTSTCSPVATQGSGRRRGGQTAHSGRTGLFPGRFIPSPPRALSIVPPMWRHKPLLVEHLMHEGDGNRALPHRRGHALDIAAPDVADREHTGQTRFEEVGRPRQRPTGGGQILRG